MCLKKRVRLLVCLAILVCGVAPLLQAAGNPDRSKQRYAAVISHLDTGGDVLVVANLEGYLQSLVSNLSLLATTMPSTGPDSGAHQTFARVPGFLDKNGFYAVQGFGASVVPRDDGLNTIKIFIARDPAAAKLPLWRGLVGTEPRELRATRFLPSDTVFVRTGNGEWPQFWKMVRAGVTEFASPKTAADFERELSNMATNPGVNLDKVVGSLGDEGFLSIQFSTTSTIEIPSGKPGVMHKIPSPSLLLGLAVKDDTMIKTFEASLARSQVPILKTQSGKTVINTLNLPIPLPVPFQPSYASHAGFVLFGSTPAILTEAIQAFDGGDGLITSTEFQKAFQGLPAANNGLAYMSPRFMKTILELQAPDMGPAGSDSAGAFAVIRQMLGAEGNLQSAFVTQNLPDGILMSGTSSSGGKEIMGSVMMAPMGLMAAIAIPSFMKARTVSKMNACINNLRILDGAKEQWAMEMNKSDGDEVNIPGILVYIKGGKLPVCPQGGTYQVNRIGQPPMCNVPGHGLH